MRGAKEEYERSISVNMKGDNKTKENIPCIMDENIEIHTDNKEKAELLNNFFKSVFTNEDSTQGIPSFPARSNHNLENVKFDCKNIQGHMEKLKERKSSCPDQVYRTFLKETAKNISVPLENIFNISMETMSIPNSWRLSNITPLHKKGPKRMVSNCRAISLTSVVCKTMEKF